MQGLGPARPTVLALTTALQTYTWWLVLSNKWRSSPAAASTLMVLTLSFLPEALDYYTRLNMVKAAVSSEQGSTDSSAESSSSSSRSRNGDAGKRAGAASKVTLTMEMGCVSCVKAVLDHLGAAPEVIDAEVHFERGEAEVWLADEPTSPELLVAVETITTLLDDGGFKPTIVATVPTASTSSIASTQAAADVGLGGGATTSASGAEKKVAAEDEANGCCSSSSGGGGSTTTPAVEEGGSTTIPSTTAAGDSWVGMAASIGAGLLSSSCCLLQLGLNALSMLGVVHVGCAGFNKVLGPHRTHLRYGTGTFLAGLWAYSLWVARRQSSNGARGAFRRACSSLAVRTVVTLGLMFLPELLQYISSAAGGAGALEQLGAKRISLEVDGMGCEACELYVKGLLDTAGGVLGSSASFASGAAEVLVVGNEEGDFNLTDLLRVMEDDGYPAKVVAA